MTTATIDPEIHAAEHALQGIAKVRADEKAAYEEYRADKARLKASHAAWEEAVERLHAAVDAATEELPLFDKRRAKATASANGRAKPAEPTDAEFRPAIGHDPTFGDNEALKVKLAEIFERNGISEAITAKFSALNIQTVGQLAEWQKQPRVGGGANELTDIDGIGEAKAAKIADALEAFWVAWRCGTWWRNDDE